jgi:hypothetical protein
MKPSDLPRAAVLAVGEALRVLGAKAVDEALADAARRGGVSPKATRLHVLATAIASAVASVRDTTAPAISTRTQAFGVPTIVLTYAEDLDPAWVPPVAAFAITSPVRTVTAVRVQNRQVQIDYSGAVLLTADSPDIAYTQSATEGHRDLGGTLAASFTAAAVTVAGA